MSQEEILFVIAGVAVLLILLLIIAARLLSSSISVPLNSREYAKKCCKDNDIPLYIKQTEKQEDAYRKSQPFS